MLCQFSDNQGSKWGELQLLQLSIIFLQSCKLFAQKSVIISKNLLF